jgi:uncharacterized protein (TIGR03437 family)
VIRLLYEGAERVRVDAQGDLALGGGMRQHKPRIYQEAAGVRREIPGGYVVKGRNQVGFQVGAYDRSRPLVIDPVLSYSTYLGGTKWNQASGIAVDASGNVYIIGQTMSADFPTVRPIQASYAGGLVEDDITQYPKTGDVFVAKLNAAGNALVYSTYLGGSSADRGQGIAVDASGNAYVTGQTRSSNFPTVRPISSFGGNANAFVAKLNAQGNALVYSTCLGGNGSIFEFGAGIAVDAAGSAYVTGPTASSNFPVTANAFQKSRPGRGPNAFVTKLNPEGTSYLYSTYLGGPITLGFAIAVDASGNAYVAGATQGGFPVTASAFQSAYRGGYTDAFVAKLNATGSGLIYATYLGGTDDGREGQIILDFADFSVGDKGEQARGIAVDRLGNAYVTGSTPSRNFPISNASQAAYGGGDSDAFLTKLNAQGSAPVNSTYLGGSGLDQAYAINLDASGNIYLTGVTASTNFPATNPIQAAQGGGRDAFLTKFDGAGSGLAYSTYWGGGQDDTGLAVAVDSSGNAYVAGRTASGNLRTTAGALQTSLRGPADAFVAKIAEPAVTTVSAASYTGTAVAPESIVAGFGQGLAGWTEAASSTPLPLTLAGVNVKVRDAAGAEQLAPLFYVSPAQINYLIPVGTRAGLATVTVTSGGRTVASGKLQIEAVAPSLFSANADGKGVAAALRVRVTSDGSQTSAPVFQCGAAAGSCAATPIDLGAESEQVVLLLFGTGLRWQSGLGAVAATIGGQPAEVLYAGPQGGFVGLDQVNVRLPRSLIGRGQVNVALSVDGKTANTVQVSIR